MGMAASGQQWTDEKAPAVRAEAFVEVVAGACFLAVSDRPIPLVAP